MRSDYLKVYFVGSGKTITMTKNSFDTIKSLCPECSCIKWDDIILGISFDRKEIPEVGLRPCDATAVVKNKFNLTPDSSSLSAVTKSAKKWFSNRNSAFKVVNSRPTETAKNKAIDAADCVIKGIISPVRTVKYKPVKICQSTAAERAEKNLAKFNSESRFLVKYVPVVVVVRSRRKAGLPAEKKELKRLSPSSRVRWFNKTFPPNTSVKLSTDPLKGVPKDQGNRRWREMYTAGDSGAKKTSYSAVTIDSGSTLASKVFSKS
jgi:hypothetical protein